MGGLVAYESSDEEDETPEVLVAKTKPQEPSQEAKSKSGGDPGVPINEPPKGAAVSKAAAPGPKQPIIGPQIGPEPGAAGLSYPPLEEDPGLEDASAIPAGADLPLQPGSPYSAERAAVRSLTMPTVADTEIPPSPPGSPPAATNRKFAQFLELKKKGVHFNAKVASSPALRNPALADKLIAFVGCGARDAQYATTLDPDLWDPSAFPRWAFREQLRATQSETSQARARGRGAAVDFVPAAATSTTTTSRGEGNETTTGAGTGTVLGERKSRFDK